MIIKVNSGKLINPEKPIRGDIITHRITTFDINTGKEIFESLNKAIALGQPIFPVVIDSYGGQVYALLSCIEAFQSSPIPIATIVEGKAMSCGAFLAGFGTRGYRFIGKNSYILIHHVSNFIHGIEPKIREDAKHTEILDDDLFSMLSEHCGHERSFFLNKLKPREGADWYIKPAEAISLNLADFIGSPTLEINLKVEHRLYI